MKLYLKLEKHIYTLGFPESVIFSHTYIIFLEYLQYELSTFIQKTINKLDYIL